MGILGTDYVDAVDRVGVAEAGTCQRRLLYWMVCRGSASCIPEQDLTAVSPAEDEVGMEGRELGSQYVRVGLEDIFGTRWHVRVPDEDEAWGIVGRR